MMQRAAALTMGLVTTLGLAACENYGPTNVEVSTPTGAAIEQGLEDGALTPSEARNLNRVFVEGG